MARSTAEFFGRLVPLAGRIRAAAVTGLHAFLGELRWTPPLWVGRAAEGIGRGWQLSCRHPRHSLAIAASVVVVAVGGYVTWRWYQGLPKPVEYSVSVSNPDRTCIECDPPGRPNPAVFTFSGSVAPLQASGKSIDPAKAGLAVRPAIVGEWRWKDDRTLVFTPSSDWLLGEVYTVDFARRGFTAPQVHLSDYRVTFNAPAFSAAIDSNDFYQDPVIASDKKIVTTLRFTQPVDSAALQERIHLQLFAKVANDREEEQSPAPTFTLSYDKLKLHAYVHSSQLAVLPKGGRVALSIDRGLRAAVGGNVTTEPLTDSVDVPGLYSLKVNDISLTIARDERDTPSQALILATTHSVTEPEMTARVKGWLLPVKHPDPERQANWERGAPGQPYAWNEPEVTPEVLAHAEPLALGYVANEREHVEVHSFRLKGEPHRQIYLRVDKGLRSFGGYLLADPVDRVLTFPEYPKEVHIAHQGALLALSGPRKLIVQTRDVPALRVRVGRLLPDQLQHLVTQTGGDFAHPTFNDYGLSDADITERFEDVIALPSLPAGTTHYHSLDLGPYLSKPGTNRQGVFLLTVEAFDPVARTVLHSDGGAESTVDKRLVVVTDLGLIAKRSVDGSQDVFVQSISSGDPLADTTVQVIGRNGEPVLGKVTDATGHAHLPDLHAYDAEREPVMYLATRGTDTSFLPIKSHVDTLDLSRFDVGGVSNKAEQAAMSAYLFSDRGIYRPGDEIRAAAIVKTQDWRRIPEGLPLRVEITDPRGLAVKRELIPLSAAGFEEIRYQTREAAPVGTYTINVFVVKSTERQDLIGSMNVKVQEFLPDRLRISTRFSAEQADGWVAPDQLQAGVTLENLFGTPAEGRRVRVSMRLMPADVAFPRYKDYEFRDPQAAREGFTENLSEQDTGADGRALFELNLNRFTRATYRVGLVVQGYEADGGRGVTGEATQLVSSLPFLVGWKADGRLDFISRGGSRSIDVLAIDPTLERIAAPDLRLKRLERRYVSVLLRQDSGVYKYESRLKEIPIDERALALPAGHATLTLDTATPGDFSALITDADGQVYARIDYTVAGAANLARSMEKNAELQIVLDKHDYAPGDTISLQIQAPYTGAGLITIERDHVYAWQWFQTATTSSVQKIRVPEGLEGNGYVSVTFVRDPASPEIYASPLSYGVKPFSIALDARRNPVALRSPALIKPGEDIAIGYRTAQPARLALFAVDEGILQVAHYKTPDPLAHFFQKRALDVSTRQILDLILPGFRPSMLSAPGGDQGALLGANLNPFKRKTDKPVAWWAGIVDAGTQEKTLRWKVPESFNGRLRIMAVAVNDSSIGATEQATLVRGDFVLTPNAPLTVTPGDEFDVSVGVANNIEDSGADAVVDVSVRASAEFDLVGPAQLKLKVGALHEGAARFRVRTRDVLGSGSLTFRAALGSHSAQIATTMSVRPATTFMSTLNAGSFKGSARVAVTRTLYPQFRTLEASVSMLPLALAHGLTAYLDHYPYSCTEQLVSQAMPAVVLARRPEFAALKTRQVGDLAGLVDELRARQSGDGSFRYWAGGVESVDFVSAYALHVLLEAKERGEVVPDDLLESGRGFLLGLARRDGDSLADERTGAYAIYLLARQGVVVSNEAAALQKRLVTHYAKQWSSDVVAAYLASAYQLMQQKSLAAQTLAAVRFGSGSTVDRWHDPMSADAVLLYLLSRHFPERLQRLPENFLDELVQHVQRGEFNSLSAATTILALDAYATASTTLTPPRLGLEATLTDKSTVALTLPPGLFPKVAFAPETRSLEFRSDSPLRGFYLVNESGFDRRPDGPALTQGLEITREFLDARGQAVQQVKLGDEVTVHLRFRAIGRERIDDAVLVDLLPGGFDLVIPGGAPEDQPLYASGPDEQTGGYAGGEPRGCLCLWLVSRPAGFPRFADLREDRVVLYGTATNTVQEFSYRIKATNVGTYVVPAAYGESMYDPKVRARSVSARIGIVRP
jgi:uncharacterized protein YfaS (alpha-2-macroglobulin family)